MNAQARRFALWLALLSVSLYALWPLLATAQPRGHHSYELCPHAALHEMAVESGHQQPSTNPIWDNHQLQCAFSFSSGDGASVAVVAAIILILHLTGASPLRESRSVHFYQSLRLYVTAPRGPPLAS